MVIHPGSDLDANMREAREQRLVQQFVAHPTVTALAKAILHRLARRDVMLLHAHLSESCEHGIAGQPGAIISHDHAGLAALGD